jgi:hypothetical protein
VCFGARAGLRFVLDDFSIVSTILEVNESMFIFSPVLSRWAKQFNDDKFTAKLIYNIREAFEAEIHLLNDVGAKRTIQRQNELADVFHSRASEVRQLQSALASPAVDASTLRNGSSYELTSSVRLEKAAHQMERGRSILRTLQHISASDAQLMDFLLDRQFFTPPKPRAGSKSTNDLPPAAAGAVVISRK